MMSVFENVINMLELGEDYNLLIVEIINEMEDV